MRTSEATDLAVRILGVFQGPHAGEWEETLAPLDAGRAGTAFAQCKRQHRGRWLSIAEYLERYDALRTEDGGTKDDDCPQCSNSGWVECFKHENLGQVYSGVVPCTCCAHGQRQAESQTWRNAPVRRILTDREAEALIKALRNPKENA